MNEKRTFTTNNKDIQIIKVKTTSFHAMIYDRNGYARIYFMSQSFFSKYLKL